MRNRTKFLALFILLLIVLTSCKDKMLGDLIITNINIVNVKTGEIEKEMDVIIVKDKIQAINPNKNNFKYEAENILDGSGKYLIPGLWDMHAHLSMIGKTSIPLFVLNGVLGVRDMGGNWSELEEWRTIGNKTTENMYPKIKTAGPILEAPQFYNLLQQILGKTYTKDRVAIDSEKEAYRVVDSLSKMGVDFIKVRTVKSQAIFQAISDACKNKSISFTGHIDQNIGIEFAIENGIASIEHDVFLQSLNMDEADLNHTLKSIKNSKTYFTPTMLATYNYRLRPKDELIEIVNDTLNKNAAFREYLSPKLIENWNFQLSIQALENPMKWDSLIAPLRSFAKSVAVNTTVLAGTDCGVTGIIPGMGLHEELIMLVKEMGLSNIQALQASTINAANSLNLQNEYGLVDTNYKADLLILNKNPLDDISNTSNIFAVIRNGIILDQEEIKKRLKKLANNVRNETKTFTPERLNHLRAVLNQMKSKSN